MHKGALSDGPDLAACEPAGQPARGGWAERLGQLAALGAELAAEYADKAPVILPVMSGAMCFCSDLMRAMRPSPRGTQVESIKSKSYFGNQSSGNVKVHPIEINVEGRHVLLVEDIVDTGLTIAKLKEHAKQAGAASVKWWRSSTRARASTSMTCRS